MNYDLFRCKKNIKVKFFFWKKINNFDLQYSLYH